MAPETMGVLMEVPLLMVYLSARPAQLTTLQPGATRSGISGVIGTVLAAVGILNAIQGFLSLLSAIVPALMGVMIADYWLIGKGKIENFKIRKGFYAPGMIAFVIGALIACMTGGTFATIPALSFLNIPFFISSINGIVAALVVYILLTKAFGRQDNPYP